MYFPIIDVLKENFIAKIPSIVTQWLTDNVDPVGSAVVVDESLSISGAAADAKITGDKISDLAEQFDAFDSKISYTNVVDMQASYTDANKYATISGGRVGETTRNGCTTLLFPVSDLIGKKLLLTTITDAYPYSIPYLFADNNSAPIDYKAASQTTSFENLKITVPNNAKWLYVNLLAGNEYSVEQEQKQYLDGAAHTGLINSPLIGKKCVCFGDSITWYDGKPYNGGKFANDIAVGYESYMREAGMIVNNQGYSGAHIRNIVTEKILPFDFTGYDYVTLTSGANDSRYEIPVGTLSEIGGTHDNSFIGTLQKGIEHILNSNPEVKILLITPIRGWIYGNGYYVPKQTDGYVNEAYAEAIKTVAKAYDLPVCDWYNTCGVNIYTRSWFMNDPEPDPTASPNPNDQYSLHPTAKGYKRMASILLPVLRSI